MKNILSIITIVALSIASLPLHAQTTKAETAIRKEAVKNLYLDVHHLPAKVKYEAVAKLHAKDVTVSKKYGVHFINYWVNENEGLMFWLSSAADTVSIKKTYAEGSGIPANTLYKVSEGTAAALQGKNNLFLDVHY